MVCLQPNITAIQRIYRQKSAPRHEPCSTQTPPIKQHEKPVRLNRNDVEAILHLGRAATIEELEWLLSHANDVSVLLSETEELELRNLATRKLADRHLAHRFDPSDEFIAKHVGVFRTQYGDLTAAEIQLLEDIRLKAAEAIESCKEHKNERCQCWAEARHQLYELRLRTGEGSTLALAALAVWNTLDTLARTREDRTATPTPQTNVSPQVAADITGLPQPCKYNWRYYRAPDYAKHLN